MPVVDMVMPKMGESVQEGTVIAWKVEVGASVEKDQILLDIATDKVDTEVPSPAGGTITEILVGPDQTVEVGAVIARINTDGGPAPAASAPAAKAAPAASPAAAPATAPAAAPAAATAVATAPAPAPVAVASNGEVGPIPRRDGDAFFSPLVRKLAEEHGVSLAELRSITGSGHGGRINKDDLLKYLNTRGAAPVAAAAATTTAPSAAPVAKPAKAGGLGEAQPLEALGLDPKRVKVEKLNRMRKVIATNMRAALDTAAHVYQVHEIDMTRCVQVREAVKNDFKAEWGISLTYTSFIIWGACRALRKFPWVNSRLNGDELIIPDYVNFGLAVALPDNGLVVPVIRNCEDLTISGIQRHISDLGNRARAGELSPDELSGATFSLTNLGGFGAVMGMPIIPTPTLAIMGTGKIEQRPVIRDGGIAVRWMMYHSMAFDHRIVDGAMAANFLEAVREELENIDPVLVGFDRRKK